MMRWFQRPNVRIALFWGIAVWLCYTGAATLTSRLMSTSRDTLGNRLMAAALMSRGTTTISSYLPDIPHPLLQQQVLFSRDDGAVVPRFPIGTGLLALPWFVASPSNETEARQEGMAPLIEREQRASRFLSAFTVGLMALLLATRYGDTVRPGWIGALTVAFGLGSPIWSSNATALWSHTGSALAIVLLFLALDAHERGPTVRTRAMLSVSLALLLLCRPNHVAMLLTWPLITRPLVTNRRAQLLDIIPLAGALAIVALIHLLVYHDALGPYLRSILTLGAASPMSLKDSLDAALGMIIAPGCGVIVHVPMTLIALTMGLRPTWRAAMGARLVERAALALLIVQIPLIARNPLWWGGWCWGPRLFSDLMPAFIILLIPVVELCQAYEKRLVPALVVAVGILLQMRGITYDYSTWFFERPSADEQRAGMWSLRDNPLSTSLRRAEYIDPYTWSVDEWPKLERDFWHHSTASSTWTLAALPNHEAWKWSRGLVPMEPDRHGSVRVLQYDDVIVLPAPRAAGIYPPIELESTMGTIRGEIIEAEKGPRYAWRAPRLQDVSSPIYTVPEPQMVTIRVLPTE